MDALARVFLMPATVLEEVSVGQSADVDVTWLLIELAENSSFDPQAVQLLRAFRQPSPKDVIYNRPPALIVCFLSKDQQSQVFLGLNAARINLKMLSFRAFRDLTSQQLTSRQELSSRCRVLNTKGAKVVIRVECKDLYTC